MSMSSVLKAFIANWRKRTAEEAELERKITEMEQKFWTDAMTELAKKEKDKHGLETKVQETDEQ